MVNLGWFTPPKTTPVAEVKPDPVIVTGVPATPFVTLADETTGVGAVRIWNVSALTPVPPGPTTAIGPVDAKALDGTRTVIWVSESTVNVPVGNPGMVVEKLKMIWDAPVNPVPVRTISSPGTPEVWENDVTFAGGLAMTKKLLIVWFVPPGVLMVIGPVVEPVGTTARICVPPLRTSNVVCTPLPKAMLVAPVKLNPLMTTVSPILAADGVNTEVESRINSGVSSTVYVPAVVVPPGDETRTAPVMAPAGTKAEIV